MLLDEHNRDESQQCHAVREDTHHVGPPGNLAVEPLQQVRRPNLAAVEWREREVREHVLLGVPEHPAYLGVTGLEHFGDVVQLGVGAGSVGLQEDSPDRGGDHGLGALGDLGLHIAHEVDGTSLPVRSGEYRADGLGEPYVRVAHHQLHASQPTFDEASQECEPEVSVLATACVDAHQLAVAVVVEGVGDHHGVRGDASTLPDLQVGGVQPQIEVAPRERTLTESLDLFVEPGTDSADFALREILHAHGLDEVLDLAGTDAVHVGLLDDTHERLLRPAPGLEEAREVGALPQLRDRQLERAHPRVPASASGAVALVTALIRALVFARANDVVDPHAHDLLDQGRKGLLQEIGISFAEDLADEVSNGHAVRCRCHGHPFLLLALTERPWRRLCLQGGAPDLHHSTGHYQDEPSSAANGAIAISVVPVATERRQQTPDEAFEATYTELRRELEAQLLDQIRSASPQFFEQLVVDLLVKMGYGGSHEDAGEAIGRTDDGGIDGIIQEDRLGLDAIYIQAKRRANTVGRPEIQGLAGSLQGARARKGVFITTSQFSAEARDFVSRIDTKIVLIDGKTLVRLMFDYGLGVSTVKTYEIKRIDSDYFEEA